VEFGQAHVVTFGAFSGFVNNSSWHIWCICYIRRKCFFCVISGFFSWI